MSYTNVDGFITETHMLTIGPLVKNVPEDGWIIEVGCFKGRSTNAIAENKKDSVLLTCIDPFPISYGAIDRAYENYSVVEWRANTEHLTNIEEFVGYSPLTMRNITFTKKLDLLFVSIDRCYETLAYWSNILTTNGTMVLLLYDDCNKDAGHMDQINLFIDETDFVLHVINQCAVIERK